MNNSIQSGNSKQADNRDQPPPYESRGGFAEINGVELYYEVQGEGQPIILINDSGLDSRMWDYQFNMLAQHYKVVRYDQRASGKSLTPDMQLKRYSEVADIHALLKSLHIEHACLLGCSQGAIIATDFALEHPRMVDALILVSPVIDRFSLDQAMSGTQEFSRRQRVHDQSQPENEFTEILEQRMNKLAPFISAYLEGDFAQTVDYLINDPSFSPGKDHSVAHEKLREILLHNVAHSPVGRRLSMDTSTISRLHDIKVPILLLVGERDDSVAHEAADDIAETVEKAHKVVVPSAPRLVNMDQPEVFNQLVSAFLWDLHEG